MGNKIIKLKRGLKANVSAVSTILDGEPLVALDSGELYVGYNNAPRKIGDVEKTVATKAALTALTGIDGKMYIVLADESNNGNPTLYLYTNSAFKCLSNSLIMNDASSPNSSILWSSQKTSDTIAANVNTAISTNVTNKLGVANGLATLDSNGLVPTSQIPNTFKDAIVVNDITARDAMTAANLFAGLHVLVKDATGDTTVKSGYAEYICVNPAGTTAADKWVKIAEGESLDLVLSWANIVDRPTSTATQIDKAVTDDHTHSNKTVLDALTDASGKLNYSGAEMATEADVTAQKTRIDTLTADATTTGSVANSIKAAVDPINIEIGTETMNTTATTLKGAVAELVSTKLAKVVPAAANNVATLDVNGNITDSGLNITEISTIDGGTF